MKNAIGSNDNRSSYYLIVSACLLLMLSFGIVLPALARAVGESRRQMALGLGTAAGSIGQFAVVPLAQWLINDFGWIAALNVLAASSLAMALLAIPLAPYSGKAETQSFHQKQTVSQALQEALAHRRKTRFTIGRPKGRQVI